MTNLVSVLAEIILLPYELDNDILREDIWFEQDGGGTFWYSDTSPSLV